MHYIELNCMKSKPLNTESDGCMVTLTTAHNYSGNNLYPRQGFREGGVLEIYEIPT